MNPNQFKQFLKNVLLKKSNIVINVMGKVGVGKSETVQQVADELGYELRDIRLSLSLPDELKGMPYIDKDKLETIWLKPDFFPKPDYEKPVVLFFDEFNRAVPTIQNACLQLVLNRRLGNYVLPKNTRVVLAGNKLDSDIYVTKLSKATSNRLVTITFEPTFDDWKIWAYKHNINPLIIGYHNYTKGQYLNQEKVDEDSESFATPRSWFFCSEILDLGLENGVLYEAIKGCIGESAGTEFYGYMKIYKDLPNPDEILDGKDIVPSESNIMYALCSALINSVLQRRDKVGRLIQYSLKIQKEFSVVLVKDLLHTDAKDDVMKSKEFSKWVSENKEIIL